MTDGDPIIIKRYPNRKLYDTQAKKYVTLEAIEQLIRTGRDVRVLDNETGEDITTLTLSNIILETQKKPGGILPKFVFTDLIQRGGVKMFDYAKKVVGGVFGGSAPDLDALVRRTLDEAVRNGKLGRDQAEFVCSSLLRSLHDGREKVEAAFGGSLERVLHRMNLPTRSDLERIDGAIRDIESKLRSLDEPKRKRSRKPAGAGRARKKTSPAADE